MKKQLQYTFSIKKYKKIIIKSICNLGRLFGRYRDKRIIINFMVVSYISDAQWLVWSLAVLTTPINTLSSLPTPLTLSSTITNSPVAGLLPSCCSNLSSTEGRSHVLAVTLSSTPPRRWFQSQTDWRWYISLALWVLQGVHAIINHYL
jgi:hypothetical protein